MKHAFAVFCGAKLGVDPAYQKMATDLAHLFHAHDWTMGEFVSHGVQRRRNW
jgi:hypothetical protein